MKTFKPSVYKKLKCIFIKLLKRIYKLFVKAYYKGNNTTRHARNPWSTTPKSWVATIRASAAAARNSRNVAVKTYRSLAPGGPTGLNGQAGAETGTSTNAAELPDPPVTVKTPENHLPPAPPATCENHGHSGW